MLCHRFRSPAADDFPTVITTFRTQIDKMIRPFDHIEIVLNDQDGTAPLHKPLQHFQKTANIIEVETGCRLIQYIERFSGIPLGKIGGQFDPLRLPTGKGCCRLSQTDISQPHVKKGLQLALSWPERH